MSVYIPVCEHERAKKTRDLCPAVACLCVCCAECRRECLKWKLGR